MVFSRASLATLGGNQKWSGRLGAGFAPQALGRINPNLVLDVPVGAKKAEIRAAFLQKIREMHPDVSQGDTTEEAARVIAAYKALVKEESSFSQFQGDYDQTTKLDVFESPDGAAEQLFINPFGCIGVDPFMWRELQDVACQGNDPEIALLKAGVSLMGNAIHFVSNGQMEALREELGKMEENMDVEVTRWYIEDCLVRAQRANGQWRY